MRSTLRNPFLEDQTQHARTMGSCPLRRVQSPLMRRPLHFLGSRTDGRTRDQTLSLNESSNEFRYVRYRLSSIAIRDVSSGREPDRRGFLFLVSMVLFFFFLLGDSTVKVHQTNNFDRELEAVDPVVTSRNMRNMTLRTDYCTLADKQG